MPSRSWNHRWRGALALASAFAALVVTPALAGSLSAKLTAPVPHVVIAVIDTSVNVYHQDFAAPNRTSSPASWLAGYPTSAKPLRLHLREKDFASARSKDDAAWATLKPGALYYLPGTRFSGVVYLPSPLDKQTSQVSIHYPPPSTPPRPVIDGYTYHGTGAASVAAGARYGSCPDCDIVFVAADNLEDGLAWASRQPWIDVISNSWGGPFGVPTQATGAHPERAADTGASPGSLAAARAGKAVVFGSGNGVSDLGPTTHGTQHSLTWDSPYAGPPWVLAVGAAKARTGQPTDWHNIPVDVIAQGEERPMADSASLRGEDTFVGTSCSAPIAAGVLAEALFQARRAVRDQAVGVTRGSLLRGSSRLSRGPAADGKLTYQELFDAARAVASWKTFDPSTVVADPMQAFTTPTTPAAFAYEGFGLLDKPSVNMLVRVLLGQTPMPARPEMIAWQDFAQTTRSSRWGGAPGAG